ncbi:MAG: hydroxymethylbilane synthase [Acidimicrobiia bacterium]|nr:hydroxymethylbilane synthase [Acidimicrobiia bacterium]
MIRAATRGSALARWQADHVAWLLGQVGAGEVAPVVVSTAGDRDKVTPLHVIGGKGVFVKEVQAAVLDGRADIAVHSAKDLPAITPDGLVICGVPERADHRDVLIGCTLDDLSAGARVGTGSIRRQVQLRAARPGIEMVEIRGNIDTRLALVGELDAIVMAGAALDRLGLSPEVVDRLDPETMLPQVGQGTLAIECRADDLETIEALAKIDDARSHRRLDAERGFLVELGGDCDLPAGAFAQIDGDEVLVRAMLANGDGEPTYLEGQGTNGTEVGRQLAIELRSLVS